MTTEEKLKAAIDAMRGALLCLEEGNINRAIVLLSLASKQ